MKTKQSTLYRVSLALLTIALVTCASFLAYEQREALRVQDQRNSLLNDTAEYKRKLARQRQINAELEKRLNQATRQPQHREQLLPLKPNDSGRLRPREWILIEKSR